MEVKMKTRIITAIVAILIFLPILYFSGTIIFPIAMAVLCAVACFEMLQCTQLIKRYAISVPVLLIGAALPLLPYYSRT